MTNDAVVGLIGVGVGWGLTSATDWIRASRGHKQRALYLATRLSILLDQYITACMWVVKDDGYGPSNPNFDNAPPEPQVELPPIPDYPTDVDWKSIDHQLMVRLLTLPVEARAANDQIDFAVTIDGPPWNEVFEERQVQYSRLGLSALLLKEDLEKICGTASIPLKRHEPHEIFKQRLKEHEHDCQRQTAAFMEEVAT